MIKEQYTLLSFVAFVPSLVRRKNASKPYFSTSSRKANHCDSVAKFKLFHGVWAIAQLSNLCSFSEEGLCPGGECPDTNCSTFKRLWVAAINFVFV